MHMGIVYRPNLFGQECFYGISCDIVALLKGGRGESLIKKQQTFAFSRREHLLETDALLAQSAQVHSFVLVRREMGIDAVAGDIPETFRRYEKSALRQDEKLTYRLGYGSFSATVRTGEYVYGMLSVESKVICYDIADVIHIHSKFQVVKALCQHGRCVLRFRLGLAEYAAFFHKSAYKLRTFYVVYKLRHKSGNIHYSYICVLCQSVPEFLHK